MNNTTLNYGNGIRQICLHDGELVFLDAKPSKLWGRQYHNPVHLDELDINEIGDLKLEIEEKYLERSALILSQLNINP
jgi:hypothetical protein